MFGFEFEQNLQDVRLSTSLTKLARCPPIDVLPKFLPTDVFHTNLSTFFLKYPIKKYVPLAYILSESIERISNFDENLL